MIVMKFGGTSVGDAPAIRRLTAIVGAAATEQPLVIVSAMSKVTNALLNLEQQIATGDVDAATVSVAALRERHGSAAAELALTVEVQSDIVAVINDLASLVSAEMGKPTSAERSDRVVGYGEALSSRLVAGALTAAGVEARWCDVREVIVTNANFGSAIPDSDAIAREAAARLAPLLATGATVVTQGFIGRCEDGRSTTLGRGGSDFSAALLGAALHAARVEIWTDVDGLMSADPRVVPEAHLLSHATYDEAAELAAFGAKVLHPATQLPLVEAGIPIVIRNTFAPERPGTWVNGEVSDLALAPVRSISFKPGVTIVQIRAPRMLGAYGFLRQIFEVFEKHQIVVDVLATSEVSISLTVDDSSRLAAVQTDLAAVCEIVVRPARGVVAVVGRGIRETPGIAARVYTAIADVNVEMISQGASASNLTFIVKEADGPGVVRALHRTFFGESM